MGFFLFFLFFLWHGSFGPLPKPLNSAKSPWLVYVSNFSLLALPFLRDFGGGSCCSSSCSCDSMSYALLYTTSNTPRKTNAPKNKGPNTEMWNKIFIFHITGRLSSIMTKLTFTSCTQLYYSVICWFINLLIWQPSMQTLQFQDIQCIFRVKNLKQRGNSFSKWSTGHSE